MTATGYQDIVFTEINPTSTTTPIIMFFCHNPPLYADECDTYTLGPVTIISNSVSLSPVTTPVAAPTTPAATVTVYSSVTVTQGSGTSIRPPCEYIIATLSSIAFWLLA